MNELETQYFTGRQEWRDWLSNHFSTKDDVWLEYPKKRTGKKRILYNDAVEEALCFGWIDSIVKSLNEDTTIQRFCKRRKNSSYSQPNRERLNWLYKKGLIHDSIVEDIKPVIEEEFIFPEDIVELVRANKKAWSNYQKLSASYKRIRIAYIESARRRTEEFSKRLNNFIAMTAEDKLIKGYGGIEKYY